MISCRLVSRFPRPEDLSSRIGTDHCSHSGGPFLPLLVIKLDSSTFFFLLSFVSLVRTTLQKFIWQSPHLQHPTVCSARLRSLGPITTARDYNGDTGWILALGLGGYNLCDIIWYLFGHSALAARHGGGA